MGSNGDSTPRRARSLLYDGAPFDPLHACTSLIPVKPLLPFWTVNLEGLSTFVCDIHSLIQLTYNSEQNCGEPITMRVVVKNQSHVSRRSAPRHFIRSLRVRFYSCLLLKQLECIDHVGSAENWRVLTQICDAEKHVLAFFSQTLYRMPWNWPLAPRLVLSLPQTAQLCAFPGWTRAL